MSRGNMYSFPCSTDAVLYKQFYTVLFQYTTLTFFNLVCSERHLHMYKLLSLRYCFSCKPVFRSHLWAIRYIQAGIHKAMQWMIPLKKCEEKVVISHAVRENHLRSICGTGSFVLTMFTVHPPHEILWGWIRPSLQSALCLYSTSSQNTLRSAAAIVTWS